MGKVQTWLDSNGANPNIYDLAAARLRSASTVVEGTCQDRDQDGSANFYYRRRFFKAQSMETTMIQPGIEFTYEATAALGIPISIGATADGERRIVPILHGRVEGPLIRGEIIGGGADWQLTRPDGVTVLDATYALKTEDGVVIQIRNRGLRHGPPEVMAALAGGEGVDPSLYYFRTVPEFIAPVGGYEWLNHSIFLCTGARYPRSIKLWVWRVT